MLIKFALFVSATLFIHFVDGSIHTGSVPVKIINRAGAPIEVYWAGVNKKSQDLVKTTQRPIRNSSESVIESYNTHEFVIKYLDPKHSGHANFTKGPSEETITVVIDEATNNLKVVKNPKSSELLTKIKDACKICESKPREQFSSCVSTTIAPIIEKAEDEKALAEKYLASVAKTMRNYTCGDDTLKTSSPISSYVGNFGGNDYIVDVMLDLDAAKVWYIDEFITDEECAIFREHGLPRLHRATVAGDGGESVISENRKAQQASYDLHHKNKNDPLYNLSQRILQVMNSHAGYNLTLDGQEGFTIIQYNVNDEYTPHCDASCDGTKIKQGGRIGTALMYCKEAIKGGATLFTKTNIMVRPKVRGTTFFSYKGSDNRMDDGGYTEHTSCPIREGEKWAITFWMREGVTKEEPWTLFDPSGVRRLSEDVEREESEEFVEATQ